MNCQITCPVCKLTFDHEYNGSSSIIKLRCPRCKSHLEYNKLADPSNALNCVDKKYLKNQILLKRLAASAVLLSLVLFVANLIFSNRDNKFINQTSNAGHKERPQKEPTLIEVWMKHSKLVKGMSVDEKIMLAKSPPELPEILDSPQVLISLYEVKEMTKESMLDGVTSLQENMLRQSFSSKWNWPQPNNPVKINTVDGTVKEIRRKGIVESFFEMWGDEPVDWYVVVLEKNGKTFIVYMPPELENDLARIQMESWFDFGSCLSVSASRYVPEEYWKAFWTPPNER